MSLILKIIDKSKCVGVTLLKDGDLKLKEVREKMIEEKIIETNFSFLFHNITVSEKTGSPNEC